MPTLGWAYNRGRINEFIVPGDCDEAEVFYLALRNIPRQYLVNPGGRFQLLNYDSDHTWRVIWERTVAQEHWPYIDVDGLFDNKNYITTRAKRERSAGGFTNPCGEIFLGDPQMGNLLSYQERRRI